MKKAYSSQKTVVFKGNVLIFLVASIYYKLSILTFIFYSSTGSCPIYRNRNGVDFFKWAECERCSLLLPPLQCPIPSYLSPHSYKT